MINNILNTIKSGQQYLETSGLEKSSANLEAMILLSYIIAKPKSYLLTWPDKILTNGQVAMYKILLERRALGEPIAYITGQKEFYSLLFKVTPDTLIPRPETELLVDTILDKFKNHKNNNIKILDLGTGTGAIAITLAKLRPNWSLVAVDNSVEALEVAASNAIANSVSNIEFIKSHWTDQLIKNHEDHKFDCIVSNPPYIAPSDQHLTMGDLRFEPKSALIADNNGLVDITYILTNAKYFLKPKALVLIEHGYRQFADIKKIAQGLGCYKNITCLQDYANLDRAMYVVYDL